jgi:hypothetical protein
MTRAMRGHAAHFILIKPKTAIYERSMSAEIIQFVQRPKQQERLFGSPVPTRSAFRADDLTMDHADTGALCENVLSISDHRERSDRNN